LTGEDTVNQALFRRRTFEQDWLAPLITVARRQPVTEQPVGDWALALALVDEAANWLGFGESVGYFAEAKAPELPTGGVVGPWMESTDYSPFDEEAFARDLLTALEDLTPARRTFLSLMFFEDDGTFTKRLNEVREVADALAVRPWLTIGAEGVDRTAWSLDGADLHMLALGPATWRMEYGDLWRQDVHTGPITANPARRYEQLAEQRQRIAAAMQSLVDYEQTPPELRTHQFRTGGIETAEAWLPTWAAELGREEREH